MQYTFARWYKKKQVWLLEHGVFISIPITIAIMHFPQRPDVLYAVLGGSTLYMGIIAYMQGAQLSALGLGSKHFFKALRFIIIPTIIAAILIMFGKRVFPQAYIESYQSMPIMLTYVFISVPLQELLFRGFCLWRCILTFKSHFFIILFNSLNFAMMHILFNNMWFIIGVFILNIVWSYGYLRYRNIYPFFLSHALLGILYFLPI